MPVAVLVATAAAVDVVTISIALLVATIVVDVAADTG